MYKNRSNRRAKDSLPTQGYKDYETGETHAPMNESQPRVGIAKRKRRQKCHCKDICGGHKNITIAESENWEDDLKKG